MHNDYQTHCVCNKRLKKEGGKAKCCECNPHKGCDFDEVKKAVNRVMDEYGDTLKILGDEIPMGVSQWRAYGEKYGYYDYFAEEIRQTIKKDLLKIADAGEYEDLRREVEDYFNNLTN